jgi:sec-independent protein translocase protein TatC
MEYPENNKNFLEHLEDLRHLIFKVIFAVALLLPFSFFFADDLIKLLVSYSCPPDFSLRFFSPMEPLFVKIKISLLAAFIAALPYIAYVIWKFVVPALYPHERIRVKQLAISSWFLFIAGAVFCFFFIIPAMMRFSLSMQTSELQPAIGLSNYISLSTMLLLGFGVMFQLPIIVVFLILSGIIELNTLKKLRAIVLIIILTLSAILTPPDVISQLMMAVPTYLLFELSLLVSSTALRTRKKEAVESSEETVYEYETSTEKTDSFFPSEEESEDDPEDYIRHYKKRPGTKRKMRYISRR